MWFEIYSDLRGEYRWRLWLGDGTDKIADSAASYTNRNECEQAIGLVQSTNQLTPVEDKTRSQPQGLWGLGNAPRDTSRRAHLGSLADTLARSRRK